MPKAVSCPKDVPLPASACLWPLSALNKNLEAFSPVLLCARSNSVLSVLVSLLGRQRTHVNTLSVARVGLEPASPSPDTVPGRSLSQAQRRGGMPSLRCRLHPCKHSPGCGTALAAHALWEEVEESGAKPSPGRREGWREGVFLRYGSISHYPTLIWLVTN